MDTGIADARVQRWVSKQLQSITETGRIVKFEVWHSIEGHASDRLATLPVDEETDSADASQEIWDAAVSNAQTHVSDFQRYIIQAYTLEDEREPFATHAFVIQGRAAKVLTGSGTNPATEKGALGQIMRHAESKERAMMAMVESTTGRLIKRNEVLEERVQAGLAQQMRCFEMMQDLADRKHQRELETAKETRSAQRLDEMLTLLTSMAPILLQKFLIGDKPVASLPGAQIRRSPRETAIMNLMKGLSENEKMALFQSISAEKRGVLLEIMQSFQEEFEEEESEKPDILQNNEETQH